MSAEITPAIERAERALVEAWHGTVGRAFHPTRVKEARATLAAALDVEEMAQALFAWNTPQNPYFVLQGRPDGSGEVGQDEDPYLPIARAIRTALLGADS